jgi:hypothetical protein
MRDSPPGYARPKRSAIHASTKTAYFQPRACPKIEAYLQRPFGLIVMCLKEGLTDVHYVVIAITSNDRVIPAINDPIQSPSTITPVSVSRTNMNRQPARKSNAYMSANLVRSSACKRCARIGCSINVRTGRNYIDILIRVGRN